MRDRRRSRGPDGAGFRWRRGARALSRAGRILVTGAGGFVGHALVHALAARGHDVAALGGSGGAAIRFASAISPIEPGDLRDPAVCRRALRGCGTVVHLAARRSRSGVSVEALRGVNQHAALRLAEEATAEGDRHFVHVSTALVFGSSSRPVGIDAPLVTDPRDPYVSSKASAVEGLRSLRAAGAAVSILHPAIVYGPPGAGGSNLVGDEIRRTLRRPIAFVVAGGRVRRDLVHVDDVVAALVALVEHGPREREVLASADPVTHRELLALVRRATGRKAPLVVSVPVSLARLLSIGADRALGRPAATGARRAVETVVRPWRFRPDGFRELLGRDSVPTAAGLAATAVAIDGSPA